MKLNKNNQLPSFVRVIIQNQKREILVLFQKK